jgi:PKD repeat protein
LKVHFENRYSTDAKFSWIFGDGRYSDQKSPDWIFDREGEFRVVLNAYGLTGLISTYSVVIKVYAKPEARFETSPGNALIPDDEILFLNYSTSALNYTWDFGDGTISEQFEPRHKYQKFGKYDVRLTVNTEHGCSDTTVVADAFSGSGFFIRMPNAFIPNPLGPSGGSYSSKTDESSEIFHPVFSGVSEYQLRIFSKLGILIFESNDINIGWDGYFKGEPANPGVYIWKIRGSFSNGEQFTKMGDVTLLKN